MFERRHDVLDENVCGNSERAHWSVGSSSEAFAAPDCMRKPMSHQRQSNQASHSYVAGSLLSQFDKPSACQLPI